MVLAEDAAQVAVGKEDRPRAVPAAEAVFFAEVRGLTGADWLPRSREILEFVGLGEFAGRRAGRLSGGMKQKLGLAAALVHRPGILLLDEPTTGVDPATRQSFWQLIIRLVAEENLSVLVSTPYMDEAGRCNRVGFMQAGRLALEGPPGRLRERLADRILEVVGFPLAVLRDGVRDDPDVEDAQMFGDCLHVRTRAGTRDVVAGRIRNLGAERAATVERVRPVAAGLEDGLGNPTTEDVVWSFVTEEYVRVEETSWGAIKAQF